jgi:hypothetical protein
MRKSNDRDRDDSYEGGECGSEYEIVRTYISQGSHVIAHHLGANVEIGSLFEYHLGCMLFVTKVIILMVISCFVTICSLFSFRTLDKPQPAGRRPTSTGSTLQDPSDFQKLLFVPTLTSGLMNSSRIQLAILLSPARAAFSETTVLVFADINGLWVSLITDKVIEIFRAQHGVQVSQAQECLQVSTKRPTAMFVSIRC